MILIDLFRKDIFCLLILKALIRVGVSMILMFCINMFVVFIFPLYLSGEPLLLYLLLSHLNVTTEIAGGDFAFAPINPGDDK